LEKRMAKWKAEQERSEAERKACKEKRMTKQKSNQENGG
jgi:uncharacterized small protein (DUF1192 family)